MNTPSYDRAHYEEDNHTMPLIHASIALALAALPAAGAPPTAVRDWSVSVADDVAWSPQVAPLNEWKTEPGMLLGARFSAHAVDQPRGPRVVPTFDDVCGGVAEEEGSYRVAVVVDFGRPVDAVGTDSPGRLSYSCATATNETTVAQVLESATAGVVQDGRLCSVELYPEAGCGEPLAELSPEAAVADAPVAPEELPKPPSVGNDVDPSEDSQAGGQYQPEAEYGDAEQDGDGLPAYVIVLASVLALAAIAGGAVLLLRKKGILGG